MKMRVFNVVYSYDGVDGDSLSGESETQFDIEDGDFISMFNELTGLFNDFSRECRCINPRIVTIYEVYEGEYDE